MSLFSSSFIEEEHQIWYFLETSQIYIISIINIANNKLTRRDIITKAFLLLISSRLLRSINQTGNKWIHLKDFGDYLKEYFIKLLLYS